MSIDEPQIHDHQPVADQRGPLTAGILSLALGLTAVMGGGTLASAIQFWTFDLARNATSGGTLQTVTTLPPIVLGIVAIVLGVSADRSSHPIASALGRAGAIIGLFAIVGGAAQAVAMLSSDFY